jgi:hypothetical protein
VSSTENAIDEAITAHCQAEGWTGVQVGWVALVATVDHDGEDERSGIITIYPGGSMQWPLALGIVEAARIRMHSAFAAEEP